MSAPQQSQTVFPDTNVFIEALVSPYSVPRAILIMARLKMFRLQLSPYVEAEIEGFLLRLMNDPESEGARLTEDYQRALILLAPDRLPLSTEDEIQAHSVLIRHYHDVPVLASATKARPNWLITSNVGHFNAEVAARTGLRIVTPHAFLRQFKLP